MDMDPRLTLLLFFICSIGAINAEVAENGSSSTVAPMIPSHSPEVVEGDNENSVTAEVPVITTTVTSGPSENVTEEVDEDGCLSKSSSSRKKIATAIEKLGMKLLQNLETTPDQPNIIISPLSIALGLSQLALGAVNETEELLMHHLHNHSLPCYHQALRHVLSQLRNIDLQLATRIFLRKGFEPKQEFIEKSQQFYGSDAAVVESLEQINEWVDKATNGKMNNFLTALPPNMLLMLINAIHFKGQWQAQFDPRFTSRGVFYLDENSMVDVEVMEAAKHPLSLFTDNELEAQVARFPFLNSMSLLVIMPVSGHVNISSIATKLNLSNIYERLPREKAVQVKIPKFKLEYCQELQEVFIKLGLGDVFGKPNLADISDGPLLVSSVQHKSIIEINEEGAEAAAATTVVISRASNPVFHLTQPFFIALVNDVLQLPVFMGVINNPSPGAPIIQRADPGDKFGYTADKNYMGTFGGPPK
ncbi:serpin peptidase inhibitor, clade F (alpha-2 antiplasmin, pigment epithelium derived factor), member 2b [Periophthalmus magnuspinnatus]|uniref:serpin peptidase inhibitor, clade F (alpha-2 antiplasmin, pigment epithelium derived factor), member 2b n=1 Tax=Periophthalmus magnuspinnatus TaxID=409849 RepID=UPI00145B399F|nr:serpin peptidase inhibitor, clade F (alpha-2 antiplasmin, pigment epithelium derived factor), member 2b [Periophthalmus magnuspinnatus]